MRLFYDPNITPSDTKHTLSEDESKHVIRVLRMKLGERIGILDGDGSSYTCEIIDDSPKRCGLSVIEVQTEEKKKHRNSYCYWSNKTNGANRVVH